MVVGLASVRSRVIRMGGLGLVVVVVVVVGIGMVVGVVVEGTTGTRGGLGVGRAGGLSKGAADACSFPNGVEKSDGEGLTWSDRSETFSIGTHLEWPCERSRIILRLLALRASYPAVRARALVRDTPRARNLSTSENSDRTQRIGSHIAIRHTYSGAKHGDTVAKLCSL